VPWIPGIPREFTGIPGNLTTEFPGILGIPKAIFGRWEFQGPSCRKPAQRLYEKSK